MSQPLDLIDFLSAYTLLRRLGVKKGSPQSIADMVEELTDDLL